MYEYPFGNGQQLNLDWFLSEWKNLLAAWEAEKNGIEGALQAEIDRAEAALADVFAARDAAAQSAANALESKNAAAQSASDASGYLATVRADANTASNAAQNAAQSESNAADSASAAAQSQTAAGSSASAAAQSETAAGNSASAAADSQTAAGNSASAAAQSQTAASNSASAAAQSAKDAEDAAASVEASAQQISTNTSDINDLKESIKHQINIRTDDKNIWNPSIGYESGRALDVNGEINNVSVAFVTDYIEIAPEYTFKISQTLNSSAYANCFYDENKIFINSYLSKPDAKGLTLASAPKNAKYLRAIGLVAQIDSFTIEVYETPLEKAKSIIAPVLNDMTADRNLVVNDFRIVDNTLYRVTTNIASGGTLTVGTNVVVTTVGDVLKSLLT